MNRIVYLYAFQIYFDFSGYTDIARGLGLMFGFRWPENFRSPYTAASVQEFWQRWHITLSSFLRDYVYIPLGGNRHGILIALSSLIVTMLLGGLWHGSSWSFVIWGGLHGSMLAIHRLWKLSGLRKKLEAVSQSPGSAFAAKTWRLSAIFVTFHCVCVGWCFFRLNVTTDSLACLQKWAYFSSATWHIGFSTQSTLWILLAVYGVVVSFIARIKQVVDYSEKTNNFDLNQVAIRGASWGLATGLLVLTFVMAPASRDIAFIYFQF